VKILIEITPEHYDGLLQTCEESSPEYAILKNGIVARPQEDGLDRRKVVIWCEVNQAARLLAAAERLDPVVAAKIAKEIELAREL
jgi:hypothetical protein